jgi:hypothetical protein
MFCRKRTDWKPGRKAISSRTSILPWREPKRTFEENVQTGHVRRYNGEVKIDLGPNLPVDRVPGLIL